MTTIAHASPAAARAGHAGRSSKGVLTLVAAVLVAFVAAAALHHGFGPIGHAGADRTAQDWHGNWSVSSRQ